MVNTTAIHALIARARRRLRLQAALDTATTVVIPALAAALGTVYAVRCQAVSEATGLLLLGGCAGIVIAGAVLGALRRLPTHVVATRIDRASNLSDRLATACAFESTLGQDDAGDDEQTVALMHAAVRDAVHSVPKADVRAATPFTAPRDSRAALAFAAVTVAVAGLYWPGASAAGPAASMASSPPPLAPKETKKTDVFEEDDIDYTRDLLEDLRRVAKTERDPTLDRFVREVEELLAKAELGQLSKEELLERLTKAEERFMQGADEPIEPSLAELKQTGRQLKRSPLTRELGKALERGDLNKAQQELEALAEKLDSDELSAKQREQVAKALEKAADKFANRQQQRDQRTDQQIAKAQQQLRRLQRKHDQTQNERQKRRLSQRIDQKKRELKKLQREREQRQKSAQQRTLKRLHRNLKQASEQMRQSGQKNRRMASRSLRSASQDTGKVDFDRRRLNTQKKVASQMNDLKEAMRRARRRGGQGQRDLFGKNRRNLDFKRRAQGQQGARGAWRPGSGKLGQKPGQQGNQPGGQGRHKQGQSYGDSHDPDLLGDATRKSGNTKDESVSGAHGRGASRRETILSAAQKGFATRAYQKVYADYKNIVEEVMRTEKVPSGYKYYVKRYFQKIKPHAMDN